MALAAAETLSKPVQGAWLMARVLSLMLPYYEKDTPQRVREMEASDWAESLCHLPQWAIDEAVRWWKSDDNADRRKRPLEGDIASKAKEVAGIVPYARFRVREFDGVTVDHAARLESKPQPVSADAANEIMRQAGFEPKRAGGKA